MGHPKKQKKKFASPTKPYDKERIDREKKLLSSYGLRRKKEIRRAESILRDFRQRARTLQASANATKERELIDKLATLGVDVKSLDNILGVSVEQLMDRRLQSVIFKKGMANSMKHARQLILHGHVTISGRKLSWPSYIVRSTEDGLIKVDAPVTNAVETGEQQ
ncbi:MAG: 30S ribosomal protein S4 [Candidatus Aenigmarchaeota archaeon]|nr:30S ribosomal protein S4 [Candidatus Aenigmarchaeota archaeon]